MKTKTNERSQQKKKKEEQKTKAKKGGRKTKLFFLGVNRVKLRERERERTNMAENIFLRKSILLKNFPTII